MKHRRFVQCPLEPVDYQSAILIAEETPGQPAEISPFKEG